MVSFVILNYKSTNDTIECINSIKKLKGDYSIIVVDNNTFNCDEIKTIKSLTPDLVLLDSNVGFAKGNNAGAKYAIKKYHPDYLCIINSDIVINQVDFIEQINNLYKEYNFDILGPKILPEESESCNPFPVYKTLEEVENKIKYHHKLINIYQSKFKRFLLKIYLLKNIFKKKVKNTNGLTDELNVGLHGCALIFSEKYYEKYEDIFYPNTFLFHEEEFLYLKAQQDKLITLYSPKIELIHKEGQSLNKEYKNNYQKLIFRNKEIIKSLELLKSEMMKLFLVIIRISF